MKGPKTMAARRLGRRRDFVCMTYSVKEIFHTLQGEGFHAGRAAVFLRFAGCNLWSGREEDRATAICKFCDTDFVGGEKFATAEALVARVAAVGGGTRFVVVTGGEPLLQFDESLGKALRAAGFTIAIETNGTIAAHPYIDWICVSPKADTEIAQRKAHELKLAFPQPGLEPEAARRLVAADHQWLQPIDGPDLSRNIEAAIAYCLAHPPWRLSLQTHKLAGFR
jgi:7-carboxy-7-deazaguanine synthase